MKQVQAEVEGWISQFKEGYWPPFVNLARLIEEVGELSREINHRYGPKQKKADEAEKSLALELGDVLFVLVALANSLEIDLSEAFTAVMAKLRDRDSERFERRD